MEECRLVLPVLPLVLVPLLLLITLHHELASLLAHLLAGPYSSFAAQFLS
jgi:hypothetical protein